MGISPPDSARLRFRRHAPEDEAVVARLWMDAAVTRFITRAPLTRGMIAPRMNWHAGHWSRFGFGYWVVEERVTGRFVGEVGFLDIDRGIEPPIERAPELGWVSPAAQGMGHATEAALAALAWGEAAFGWRRAICLIAPGNAASIRVAGKAGFRETARGICDKGATLIFERMTRDRTLSGD